MAARQDESVIFDRFEFDIQIDRLAKAGLLYQVTNHQMGLVLEELIRRFAELSNETAGEHFTPREVIRLMVDLILAEDGVDLAKPSVVRTIYDPTAGGGGMLCDSRHDVPPLEPIPADWNRKTQGFATMGWEALLGGGLGMQTFLSSEGTPFPLGFG